MVCPICGSNNINLFFAEIVACCHCNENNVISLNLCKDCGTIWKALNDVVVEDTIIIDPDLSDFISSNMDSIDVNELLTSMQQSTSMESLVNRCIRCRAIAFEVKPGEFCCSQCNFEWEIV